MRIKQSMLDLAAVGSFTGDALWIEASRRR
jgi:hypothetical protein